MEWNVKTLRIKRQQLKSVDGGSAHHSTIVCYRAVILSKVLKYHATVYSDAIFGTIIEFKKDIDLRKNMDLAVVLKSAKECVVVNEKSGLNLHLLGKVKDPKSIEEVLGLEQQNWFQQDLSASLEQVLNCLDYRFLFDATAGNVMDTISFVFDMQVFYLYGRNKLIARICKKQICRRVYRDMESKMKDKKTTS